jgi:signal transduction histidine kinase
MRERAVEMGWNMEIETRPGAGTRIRVEKIQPAERQA